MKQGRGSATQSGGLATANAMPPDPGPSLEELREFMPLDPFGPDWVPDWVPDRVQDALTDDFYAEHLDGYPDPVPDVDSLLCVAEPEERLDLIVSELAEVDRMVAGLHHRRAVLLARADDWAATMVDSVIPVGQSDSRRLELAHRAVIAEISCATRVPQPTVAADIDTAVMLDRLPATMAALRAGRISYRHAVALADACLGLPAQTYARLEAELLPIAESSTVSRVKRATRDARERLHPEPLLERTRTATQARRLVLEPDADGMAWLHHYLPVATASGIYESVAQMATALKDPTEARTPDQLRSDVLSDLIDAGVQSLLCAGDEADGRQHGHGAVRPSVFITVPVMTLIGLGEEPATLDGYGPIAPDVARQLVADAPSFYRVLTHPITGTILDIDRSCYTPTAEMRRWLRLRDQTCRFPCCGRRALHAEIDHSIPWAHGGTTSVWNLAHLCGGDHTLKHGSSWKLNHGADGRMHWTSPTGRHYTTQPEVLIRRPDTARAAPF